MEAEGCGGGRPRSPPGDGTAEAVDGVDMAASKHLAFVFQLEILL